MKLYETINSVTAVYHRLQKQLPTLDIEVEKNIITIGGKNNNGWDVFEALLKMTQKEIDQKIFPDIDNKNNRDDDNQDDDDYDEDEDEDEHEDEDEDEDDWTIEYSDKLEKFAVKALQIFKKKYLPDDWIIESVFWYDEYDPMLPIFEFNIQKDYQRKSRSKYNEWYHVTLRSNLNSILQNGLSPSTKDPTLARFEFGTYKNRTFLLSPLAMRNKERVKQLAIDLQGHGAEGGYSIKNQKPIAILKVTLTPNQIKRLDPLSGRHYKGIYVQDHIPPENIKVVYSGKIDDYN
jgi:hypothetical protein